jgi:hypothetical protein
VLPYSHKLRKEEKEMYFEVVFGMAALVVGMLEYAMLAMPAPEPVKVEDDKMFWEGGF